MPNSSRNARALSPLSQTFTPTKVTPRGPYSWANRSSTSASWRQGWHHDAQKLMTTGCPRSSARRTSDALSRPPVVWPAWSVPPAVEGYRVRCSSGAGRGRRGSARPSKLTRVGPPAPVTSESAAETRNTPQASSASKPSRATHTPAIVTWRSITDLLLYLTALARCCPRVWFLRTSEGNRLSEGSHEPLAPPDHRPAASRIRGRADRAKTARAGPRPVRTVRQPTAIAVEGAREAAFAAAGHERGQQPTRGMIRGRRFLVGATRLGFLSRYR